MVIYYLTRSIPWYEQTRTFNPIPAVASRSVNSSLHSGVSEIASSKRELAFGRAGCQRLLKSKPQITNITFIIGIYSQSCQ